MMMIPQSEVRELLFCFGLYVLTISDSVANAIFQTATCMDKNSCLVWLQFLILQFFNAARNDMNARVL